MLRDRFRQRFAEPLRRDRPAEVHDANTGRSRRAGAARQAEVRIVAAVAVVQHFERRCCRSQHDRDVEMIGARDREVAR